MCATTAVRRGCRASSRSRCCGPVNSLPTGPEPTWMTTGVPASSIAPNASSSSGSSRRNSPTWVCSLNTSTPSSISSRDVGGRLGLGVERRRPEALGHVGGEVARPVVEVGRDAGAMGVGQRAEPSYAEGAELLDALLVAAAVADRPLPPDLRAGQVELLPDPLPGCSGGRKCTCDVEEAREAEVLPEGAGLPRRARSSAAGSVHALELAAERLLLLAVGLLGGERVALVVGLLASRQGDLDLGAAVLEVERERDQRVARAR